MSLKNLGVAQQVPKRSRLSREERHKNEKLDEAGAVGVRDGAVVFNAV